MEISITGWKGVVKEKEHIMEKMNELRSKDKIACQLMDAELIYGREHLIAAINHAVRAFLYKTNSCNSLDMEILLYASGKRQIKDAIEHMGIKEKGSFVLLLVGETPLPNYNGKIKKGIENFLKNFGLKRDDSVIEGSVDVLKNFGISEKEIKTVDTSMYGDLILEKVAMVDVIK
ncbi:MAG: hypothetical protein FE048_00260 [Thermoplasmata archaeon]|nr:MAG: hypothetical protein FE048_00260 [Thermoplasmata archaeon]